MRSYTHRTIWIGYDPAEHDACKVAAASLAEHYRGPMPLDIRWLDGYQLQGQGIYQRPTRRLPDGRLYDVVSEAAMSTMHANARFFLPRLQRGGLALFTDGDVLYRADVETLFAAADPRYAVMCVQHPYQLGSSEKKGGHTQFFYQRKNWSSVMLWNLDHPAHARLTDQMLNRTPGRDLHAFCWLQDAEIGRLDPGWNHLVGVSEPHPNPQLVHFTLGVPSVPGYEDSPYAGEWRRTLAATRPGAPATRTP